MTEMLRYQKKARFWDFLVTAIIIAVLLLPVPFARFQSWPDGTLLLERPIMPWSRFYICHVAFPSGEPVEEYYEFDWKGKIFPRGTSEPLTFIFNSEEYPLLKWQNNPELVLEQVFLAGNYVRLETFWQPLLLWPFRMVAAKLI